MVTQRDRDNRTERQQLMRPASRQLIGVPDPRPQQPVEFIPREFLPALRAAAQATVAPQAAPQAEPQAEPQVTPQQDAGVTPSATSARYDPNNPYVAEAMRLEEKYNLPKGVFLAVIQQESGFNPNAVSKAGAYGLAQLMPGTASGLNVDPRDWKQNLDGGARYLAEQIATFGELPFAVAAYNAGPGAVRKAGNAIPNFPETQKYVAAVMRNAGYPMAPPKLADGGLIELARKYADGGSVAGAAQVYDPAVIAAIAASITEPQGYAEGGQVDVAPTSSVWDRYLPRDLPDSAYGDLQQNLKYLPLNIKRLLDAGAIRITQPGSGDESNPHAINSSDPEKWSLVTAHNDRNSDSYTRGWASKPESYESAIKILNDPGALYDGKYRQILWSARKLGLRPDEVFMPKEEARSPAASGRGYADGGGVSSDDATPRTFADLVRRYAVGDAMQMAAPLDDPSLGANVSQSIGDYFRPIVQGNFEVPGTLKKYAIDVATGPKPFTRLGKDIGTFGSAIWEGVKNDPVGTALDFVPVVSNVRSAMDMHESRNRAVEAEQAGDEDRASMYRQFSALGAAGAIPFVGYGAIAARRAANAARNAAARRAGAGAGTALVVRGGVDDIDIGSGVGLIAREDAAAGARGTQAIAREGAEGVTAGTDAGTDVVAREGVGLEPSGAAARRAKAAARESAQAVAVVPRELSTLGFYSHGAETAANLAQARGTPQQFRGMLEKYGVKPVELEGFDEAFAGRPSVTREELAQHFSERRPQIEETVLGKTTKSQPYPEEYTKIEQDIQSRYLDEIRRLSFVHSDNAEPWDVRTEAGKKAQDLYDEMDLKINEAIPNREALIQAARDTTTPTKFQQYTLPGGENYREVLLKLPQGSAKADAIYDRMAPFYSIPNGMFSSEFKALKAQHDALTSTFTSTHWDDPNVLAHLRMSDRTGPNGEKILHLEELQSDWGQKGRTEGFAQKLDPKILDQLGEEQTSAMFRLEDARDAFNDYYESIFRENIKNGFKDAPTQYDLPNALKAHDDFIKSKHPQKKFDEYKSNFLQQADTFTPQQRGFLQDTYDTHFEAKNAYSAARDKIAEYYSLSIGIPSAPYVTNTAAWTDLALKRAIKEAAEGGYDKIVWTPGAEQAKRWGLRSQVDEIRYIKNDDGTYNVIPFRDGDALHNIQKKNIPDKELESFFGRDVAEKMRAYEGDVRGNVRSLSGQNLEVGGEGMKAYYDKMVPNQLSKLVKRLDPDAKVGLTDVMLPQGTGRGMGHNNPPFEAPGLTITPKMREAIMKGQTDFAEGGHVQGYADGGSADNSLAALHEKYHAEPTARQRPPTYEEMGNNPVGWSSIYPPQYMSNQDPNVSPVASRTLMSDAQRLGLLGRRGPVTGADLPALEERGQGLMDNAMTVAGAVNPVGKLPVKAFHTTYEPFQNYDWSRLGKSTADNAGGMSEEKWADNLAKIGPWASERSLMKEMAGRVSLPVEIGGNAKTFSSLDALEKAVRKAGDPSAFRRSLVDQGYGHISVKDTEFGGRSFIALTPSNFKVSSPVGGAAAPGNKNKQAPAEEQTDYAQGGSVDSAPVYDPAVIAAIAASITEDNYA